MENGKLVLVLLSLIIIVSGCTDGGGGEKASSSTSVVIQNFSVTPQNPYSGQPANIRLSVVNRGEKDARNFAAELSNIPVGQGSNEWDVERWKEFDNSLDAADPESDIPARSRRITWSPESPNVDNGLDLDYNFRVNAFYRYGTTATSTVTLMSQDQYRKEGNLGRPTIENTDGPIQMEIRTRQPILYQENERMCVIVRNEGPGTPFSPGDETGQAYGDISDERYDRVKITVEDAPGVDITSSESEVVNMIRGQGERCYDITTPENGDGQDRIEVPVQFEAEYGYAIDDATTATVTGSDRFGSSDSDPSSTDDGDQ